MIVIEESELLTNQALLQSAFSYDPKRSRNRCTMTHGKFIMEVAVCINFRQFIKKYKLMRIFDRIEGYFFENVELSYSDDNNVIVNCCRTW